MATGCYPPCCGRDRKFVVSFLPTTDDVVIQGFFPSGITRVWKLSQLLTCGEGGQKMAVLGSNRKLLLSLCLGHLAVSLRC